MRDSRVIYQIDLKQLAENIAYLRRMAGNCRLMPVLKYDAYGMGADAVGAKLRSCGAVRFAVADLAEALEVGKLGLPVQILGILPDEEIPDAVANDIVCPVATPETARKISREAVRQNRRVRIAVKLDTGMGRLGFVPEHAFESVTQLLALPNLEADGLYAHFATAAKPDLEYAAFQIGRFRKLFDALCAAGVVFPNVHHAAGDAIVKIPESTRAPFNMARPGGIMYGEDFNSPCKQVVELRTRIGALRTVRKDSSVGYFRTYTAPCDVPVAVLTAGYADGIPLALSNRGSVLIHGKRCPILGRVSMDYTVVDISGVPEAVAVGDEVVLLGRRGDEAVTVHEWGVLKGTHAHDIWCSIGHRVAREYIDA